MSTFCELHTCVCNGYLGCECRDGSEVCTCYRLCRICHAEVGITERVVILRPDELYHAACYLGRHK
jgi:hypothetical protein